MLHYYYNILIYSVMCITAQTKIRGVISLLKSSSVLSTDQDISPVGLLLSPMVKTFLDLRRLHDNFLLGHINSSGCAFKKPTRVFGIDSCIILYEN